MAACRDEICCRLGATSRCVLTWRPMTRSSRLSCPRRTNEFASDDLARSTIIEDQPVQTPLIAYRRMLPSRSQMRTAPHVGLPATRNEGGIVAAPLYTSTPAIATGRTTSILAAAVWTPSM